MFEGKVSSDVDEGGVVTLELVVRDDETPLVMMK